jgi:hypothetical protein
MHALVGHSEFGCVVRRSVNYYVIDVMWERCDRCGAREMPEISWYVDVGVKGR